MQSDAPILPKERRRCGMSVEPQGGRDSKRCSVSFRFVVSGDGSAALWVPLREGVV